MSDISEAKWKLIEIRDKRIAELELERDDAIKRILELERERDEAKHAAQKWHDRLASEQQNARTLEAKLTAAREAWDTYKASDQTGFVSCSALDEALK